MWGDESTAGVGLPRGLFAGRNARVKQIAEHEAAIRKARQCNRGDQTSVQRLLNGGAQEKLGHEPGANAGHRLRSCPGPGPDDYRLVCGAESGGKKSGTLQT